MPGNPATGQVARQTQGGTNPAASRTPPVKRTRSLAEQNTNFGDIARFKETGDSQKSGSLASTATPANGGSVDILKKYTWTLSNKLDPEIPYARLREYKISENLIKQQLDRYTSQIKQAGARVAADFGAGSTKSSSMLGVYQELFPKSDSTGFVYTFPYFNKKAIELSTTWKDMADAGAAVGGLGEMVKAIGNVADAANKLTALASAPSVGVQDRPKIYETHSDRSINISFTLFNTQDPNDYKKNKDFIKLFTFQNLFNKRDYITGVPPVFYDVFIPGQYFSYASYVSNLSIENLGNMRVINGEIIPDAYQIEITLAEMMKPSKNQFEAIFTGEGQDRVVVGTK